MKVLVTGAAGFIGFHLSKKLLEEGVSVVEVDNINDYYDVNLKYARLNELGIPREGAEKIYKETISNLFNGFKFVRLNLEDKKELSFLFEKEKFDIVCYLVAQAGVRYSLENPEAYIQSNIVGFFNILECCRFSSSIKHLVFASGSSVYGSNINIPFSEKKQVDTSISLYAVTKKSNESMAHTYSYLFKIKTTGLLFITVYGAWGRPDMAPMLFANAISKDLPIKVFNFGEMERDFTFIDDIVDGIMKVIDDFNDSRDLYKIYNIGNNKTVKLLDFISEIEKGLEKKSEKIMLPIQPGDVKKTWANISNIKTDYNYQPETPVNIGVGVFV